jgi:hypothetical protein
MWVYKGEGVRNWQGQAREPHRDRPGAGSDLVERKGREAPRSRTGGNPASRAFWARGMAK